MTAKVTETIQKKSNIIDLKNKKKSLKGKRTQQINEIFFKIKYYK